MAQKPPSLGAFTTYLCLVSFNKNKLIMNNQAITVVYNWTAKPGKSEALKAIYQDVLEQMKTTEPGALKVECYFDEDKRQLVVYDLFQDAAALGQHLGTTAAGHFGDLLQIAEPGPFLFGGDVPKEMQEAALGMGLNATFAAGIFSFERS